MQFPIKGEQLQGVETPQLAPSQGFVGTLTCSHPAGTEKYTRQAAEYLAQEGAIADLVKPGRPPLRVVRAGRMVDYAINPNIPDGADWPVIVRVTYYTKYVVAHVQCSATVEVALQLAHSDDTDRARAYFEHKLTTLGHTGEAA